MVRKHKSFVGIFNFFRSRTDETSAMPRRRAHALLLNDVGAGFTPARPNDSSALSRGTCAYRRTRRREAGAYVVGNAPTALIDPSA